MPDFESRPEARFYLGLRAVEKKSPDIRPTKTMRQDFNPEAFLRTAISITMAPSPKRA